MAGVAERIAHGRDGAVRAVALLVMMLVETQIQKCMSLADGCGIQGELWSPPAGGEGGGEGRGGIGMACTTKVATTVWMVGGSCAEVRLNCGES